MVQVGMKLIWVPVLLLAGCTATTPAVDVGDSPAHVSMQGDSTPCPDLNLPETEGFRRITANDTNVNRVRIDGDLVAWTILGPSYDYERLDLYAYDLCHGDARRVSNLLEWVSPFYADHNGWPSNGRIAFIGLTGASHASFEQLFVWDSAENTTRQVNLNLPGYDPELAGFDGPWALIWLTERRDDRNLWAVNVDSGATVLVQSEHFATSDDQDPVEYLIGHAVTNGTVYYAVGRESQIEGVRQSTIFALDLDSGHPRRLLTTEGRMDGFDASTTYIAWSTPEADSGVWTLAVESGKVQKVSNDTFGLANDVRSGGDWVVFSQGYDLGPSSWHLVHIPTGREEILDPDLVGLGEVGLDGRRLVVEGSNESTERVDLYVRDLDPQEAPLQGEQR